MKNQIEETIVAPITGNGGTAVGVIRISGQKAISIANSIWSKDLSEAKGYSIHYGKIIDGERILDEVILSVFRGPKSFTGEDVVEISCHGSAYILNRAIELLIDQGARAAEPGEFSMRAYLNGQMDLSQAEAVADLISSQSSAAHQMAMYQLRGGYSEMINTLRKRLIKFASLLELELDFAEEDVEFADRKHFIELIDEILEVCTNLTESFRTGNAIKHGIPVAIVGPPNAGKSTLLNRLLKENRAIVSDIAGTTRDTIEDEMVVGGHRFRFIDTAGIRDTEDTIERLGIERSFETVSKAQVVIWLHDASSLLSKKAYKGLEKKIRNHLRPNAELIEILNKVDTVKAVPEPYHTFIQLSAKHGSGMFEVETALAKYGEALAGDQNEMIVSNQRHVQALKSCIAALGQAKQGLGSGLSTDLVAFDVRAGLNALGSITGEITTDDLLGTIFSEFCIGK